METAASLTVNPSTAFRLVTDFVPKEGDKLVVQNAANSAVGRCVIQICKSLGIKTVNIVRQREGFEELRKELEGIGADVVVSEEEMGSKQRVKDILHELQGHPLTAFNAVGGESATNMIKLLG